MCEAEQGAQVSGLESSCARFCLANSKIKLLQYAMGISLAEAKSLVNVKLVAVESLLPGYRDIDTGEVFQEASRARSVGDDDFGDMCEELEVAMHELIAVVQEVLEKITGPTVRRSFIDFVNLPWETNITRPCEGCLGVELDGRLCRKELNTAARSDAGLCVTHAEQTVFRALESEPYVGEGMCMACNAQAEDDVSYQCYWCGVF